MATAWAGPPTPCPPTNLRRPPRHPHYTPWGFPLQKWAAWTSPAPSAAILGMWEFGLHHHALSPRCRRPCPAPMVPPLPWGVVEGEPWVRSSGTPGPFLPIPGGWNHLSLHVLIAQQTRRLLRPLLLCSQRWRLGLFPDGAVPGG